MNRRSFLLAGSALTAASLLGQRAAAAVPGETITDPAALPGLQPTDLRRIELTQDQWRALLDPEEFAVLREEATERPFTSPLNDVKAPGTFTCAGCALPLYKTEWKYDSGTGWPSFWRGIDENLGTATDWKLLYPRTEVHCARCGGHQGHIFNDGPAPTGKRHCINGVAMDFVPDEAAPETAEKLSEG